MNSNNSKPPGPAKPYPNFPLFAHRNGQWAKKIKGRLQYFGLWRDWQAALGRYQQQDGDEVATPPASAQSGPLEPARRPAAPGRPRRGPKPKKPYPTFPLTSLTNGQWGKKIRGEIKCFGPWRDPEGALHRFLAEKTDLYAGRKPVRGDDLTIRMLLNEYLKAKEDLVIAGELEQSTLDDYTKVTDLIAQHFGLKTLVQDVAPQEFRRLRAKMAGRFGPVTLTNWIQRVRSVFKFASQEQLVEQPVAFGSGFKKPKPKVIRKAKNEKTPRMFTPWEIQRMLREARPDLKAMILLGVNCGFGCTDCAKLPKKIVNLEAGWLRYPRTKTEVIRRCPLWPETIEALKASLAQRPRPQNSEDNKWFFLNSEGRPYHAGKQSHWNVSNAMARLLDKLDIHRDRLGFYTLRHVFQTIGDGVRDNLAVKAIVGHAARSDDMSAFYREDIDEREELYGTDVKQRLLDVSNHIRRWVFQPEKPKDGESRSTDERTG